MQVFLIRHADAAQETVTMRDPHRHLTPLGRRQAHGIGDRLRWHDCTPTHIWASPLVRTIQTAELVASGIGSKAPVEALPMLAPDENPRGVIAALAGLPLDAVVVLVGHEPGLSAVGALLVGRSEFAILAKAQAARIDNGALRWRFAWDAEAPEIAAPGD